MTKEELMNNLYDIITNNIDNLNYENGANFWLTKTNEIYIELNESEDMFKLEISEVKDENNTTQEERLQNYYTMIREFYYEKNGIKNTIDFLKYMIELLEEENSK